MAIYVCYWTYQKIIKTSFYQKHYSWFSWLNKLIVTLTNSMLAIYLFHSTILELLDNSYLQNHRILLLIIVFIAASVFGFLITLVANYCQKKWLNWLNKKKR
ncbi:MAG: hypothetical protein L3I91_02670 [Mycoplasma sp.]